MGTAIWAILAGAALVLAVRAIARATKRYFELIGAARCGYRAPHGPSYYEEAARRRR